jgi:5-methylcytosine-specific restriction endonuclease McrA
MSISETLRRQVIERCGNCCVDCDQAGALTMHHLHYDTVGKETIKDIEGLCWSCHQQRHRDLNGQYWRDPAELAAHWFTYHEEMARD